MTIPVGINYLFRLNNKSFIDAAIGGTLAKPDFELFSGNKSPDEFRFASFVPSIGYRRHTAKDLMWRLSATPVINSNGFFPWLGFSVGKRF